LQRYPITAGIVQPVEKANDPATTVASFVSCLVYKARSGL